MHGENEDPGILITGMLSLMFYISQMLSSKGSTDFNQDVNGNIRHPLRSVPEWQFHAWLPKLTHPVSKSSTLIVDSRLHLTADVAR